MFHSQSDRHNSLSGVEWLICMGNQSTYVGTIPKVCEILEQENQAVKTSSKHTRPSFEKEVTLMVEELDEQRVFSDCIQLP